MRTTRCWVLAVGAAIALSGCTTAIKEGAGTVRGAKGLYMQIRPTQIEAGRYPLREYTRFELGTFTDEIGGRMPPELLPRFREVFPQALVDHKLPAAASGKTLLIRGQILHYEGSGTMGALLSAVEEVVARTELVDKQTGTVLAVGNCIGRSTTRVNRGVPKKADGLAKAIASWIADLHHAEE